MVDYRAPFNPSLGTLSQLPPEIRYQIWKNFIPQPLSLAQSLPSDTLQSSELPTSLPMPLMPEKTSLTILQVSQQIFNEVSYEVDLYKNETFEFTISPYYTYRKWWTMKNSLGKEWHVASFQDAISRGYANLPFHRLKGIKVEIMAPDKGDEGQMICIWRKVKDLVDLLRKVRLPHKLEILFQHSEEGVWFEEDDEPTATVADPDGESSSPYDYEEILITFSFLRGFEKVVIKFSQELRSRDDLSYNFADKISWFMEDEEEFRDEIRSRPNVLDQWTDESLILSQDVGFACYDEALDQAAGHTASMLRLHRYSTWYDVEIGGGSRYTDELKSLKCVGTFDVELWDLRFKLMRAFNPLSIKAQLHAAQESEMKNSDKNTGENCTSDGWNKHQWHVVYPLGLPPLGSSDTYRRYKDFYNEELSYCEVESLYDEVYAMQNYNHYAVARRNYLLSQQQGENEGTLQEKQRHWINLRPFIFHFDITEDGPSDQWRYFAYLIARNRDDDNDDSDSASLNSFDTYGSLR